MPLAAPITHLYPQCFQPGQPASAAAPCPASPAAWAPTPGAREGAGSQGGGRDGGPPSCVSRIGTRPSLQLDSPRVPQRAPHILAAGRDQGPVALSIDATYQKGPGCPPALWLGAAIPWAPCLG